jgi:hypothetical protein
MYRSGIGNNALFFLIASFIENTSFMIEVEQKMQQ